MEKGFYFDGPGSNEGSLMYQSTNGVHYIFLEGLTISKIGDEPTSDICFVLVDEVGADNFLGSRIVCYSYGATDVLMENENGESLRKWFVKKIEEFEKNNSEWVSRFKARAFEED